jgi:hypothetical protein
VVIIAMSVWLDIAWINSKAYLLLWCATLAFSPINAVGIQWAGRNPCAAHILKTIPHVPRSKPRDPHRSGSNIQLL